MELIDVKGEEMLYYKLPDVNISLIRATTADTNGNLTIEDEILPLDILTVAMAAKGKGGKVIAQVKNIVAADSIPSRDVAVPGIFVDAVVKCDTPTETHNQCTGIYFDKALTGSCKIPTDAVAPLPFDTKALVARRCAFELVPNAVVNLGVGVPEKIAVVASEEGLADQLVLTAESGKLRTQTWTECKVYYRKSCV